jgi:hypothetical protein
MTQIPHGPDNLICPLHRSKMSKVCHTCPLWVQLRGKNPNTGAEVDQWNCALASLPMLLVENAQQSRQNGAATESFRNVMVQLHSTSTELLARSLPHKGDGAWPPAILSDK